MLVVTTEKTKCDVKDCKNFADFYLPQKGRVGKFFVCKECLAKIVGAFGGKPPKSPQNIIKRKIEEKKEQLL